MLINQVKPVEVAARDVKISRVLLQVFKAIPLQQSLPCQLSRFFQELLSLALSAGGG